MDLISIIVPVYKVEPYIHQCVDSILGQTYQNLEIILVDDGSPDNCGQICDEYAKHDERVKVIHKMNGGVSSARNAGLDASTGELIGFIDSDDWIESDYYEKLVSYLTDHQCDVVICGMQYDGAGRGQIILPQFQEVLSRVDFAQNFWPLFDTGLLNVPFNRLWKSSAIHHSFDERMFCGEDLRFNLQNHKYVEKTGFIRTAGYHYRIAETKRGTVKYSQKPQYKGSLYSESVAEYLASVLPENEWKNKWEAFYCGNICRDTRKISLTNSIPDALNAFREKQKEVAVRQILEHKAWKTLSFKYRVVGVLLSKKLFLLLVLIEKIIG